MSHKIPPTVFVLFGATGDLAKKMVLPAFFTLAAKGRLPEKWLLVGNGRDTHVTDRREFVARVRGSLRDTHTNCSAAEWKAFEKHLRFATGGFDVAGEHGLVSTITAARRELGAGTQLVHYLAVPPVAFGPVTKDLAAAGFTRGARVVYEKPFGTSRREFQRLDRAVHSVLDESQVFRIDHFLGKQATQQLHVLRFANGLFDAMWSREHVRAVQIDVPERIGVTDRSVFYDATGAVLDMLVTHLFQVAAEVAMEPPKSLAADDLQAARAAAIGKFRPIQPHEAVLGQFDGYRDLDGVRRGSRTDTFVAARLWVDSPRWRDVPFLLRTGKRLADSEQRVSLLLREPAGPLRKLPKDGNVLSFSLEGDGAIDLRLVAEQPDDHVSLATVTSTIPLSTIPNADLLPPYSRLIHDVLVGDRSLFTRPDGLAATWRAVAPLLDSERRPRPYAPGSWGPAAAAKLAAPDGWLVGQ